MSTCPEQVLNNQLILWLMPYKTFTAGVTLGQFFSRSDCQCSAAAAAGDTAVCPQSSARPFTSWWMGVCDVELYKSDINGGNTKNPSVCWLQDRWLNSGKLWVRWIIRGSSVCVCLASPGPLCQDWLSECAHTRTHSYTPRVRRACNLEHSCALQLV